MRKKLIEIKYQWL